jgi:hypothetical protein
MKAFLTQNKAVINKYMWTKKRNNEKLQKIVLFSDACWKFFLFTVLTVIGCKTLLYPYTSSWLLDTNQFWEHWPDHKVTEKIEFYYRLQLAAYLHLFCWTDISPYKVELKVHHIVTVLLLLSSYVTNFTRIGSTLFLLYDISTVFLELSKGLTYVSKSREGKWAQNLSNEMYIMYTIIFFITRLLVFPFFILNSVILEAPGYFGRNWLGYWFFSSLLVVLLVINMYWFYFMFTKFFKSVISIFSDANDQGYSDGEEEYVENKKYRNRTVIDNSNDASMNNSVLKNLKKEE